MHFIGRQDVSDGIDKSWDHPWTTEEMRKKRREWSLAGDVGLLKHLQQFSEVYNYFVMFASLAVCVICLFYFLESGIQSQQDTNCIGHVSNAVKRDWNTSG